MKNPVASGEASPRLLERVFPVLFGCFLGLTLLKFGNPPIMEKFVVPPSNAWEFVIGYPWPISWGYGMLGCVSLLALFAARWRPGKLKWPIFLPITWLVWQVVAASQSVDSELSRPTLWHFVACCGCFYIGYFCLRPSARLPGFLIGLSVGFLLVLATGFEQHFGGLEQTRKYFYLYIFPKMKEIPPDYLKKMSSERIFATLFYPNALAGVILLLIPAVLSLIAGARRLFTAGARAFLVGAVAVAAIACLFWSGSKGGWLLLLLLAFFALLHVSFSRRIKMLLVCAVLLGGLGVFGWRYAGFFQRGATSVVARFDYWNAAVRTAVAHPLVGTGPGTFARPYAQLKRPESEMARLVHNDYLEQASDSGWPGFLVYLGFIVTALACTYPAGFWGRSGGAGAIPRQNQTNSAVVLAHEDHKPAPLEKPPPAAAFFCPAACDFYVFAIWLGVLGWALQSLFEFGLYIPALSWPAFTFLGLLLRRTRPSR